MKYKTNVKETWNVLNHAINRNKGKSRLPDNLTVNNNKISNKLDMANEFNKFFSKIGQEISESISTTNTSYKDYLKEHHVKNLFLHPIIPEYLISSAKTLKSKLSA
jgi:hypothetical protein